MEASEGFVQLLLKIKLLEDICAAGLQVPYNDHDVLLSFGT